MKESYSNRYDCIVIGGGPAGLMAALQAAASGARTAVFEKNNILCKKLRITGKGRCNLTNSCDFETLLANIPGNPKFLISSLRSFSNLDIMEFFHAEGLETVTERGGRVFPKSQKAYDVASALISAARKQKIDFCLNCRVDSIFNENGEVRGITYRDADHMQKTAEASAVIIATGGLSYPGTGSTGDGYRFAEAMGHTIVTPRPSLAALLSKEAFIRELEGLSLRNVSIALLVNNKTVFTDFGELLFTGAGVSGPVILSASAYYQNGQSTLLTIDLKPALEEQKLYERVKRDFTEYDRKIYANSLDRLLPRKLIPVFVRRSGIAPDKQVNQLNKEERLKIVSLLKHFTVRIDGIDDVKNAIVTAGGVHVKEVNPKTMESKLCRGLFFAGEVLDVDGYTGGFNLTLAFSSGHTAGRSAYKGE